ncbi:shufflon system plasmid conjugative transfer pilus tip adhesin PilV [Escherichia coli]
MNSNNLNNVGTLNGNAAALSGDISARNGTFSGAISGNTATTNGDITSNNGWLVTKNSKGWMNSTYGGGWYMSDSSWLRSVNNKGIYTGGQVKGGTVRADGRLYTGEYLQLEKTATAGASCSPNGLVGRDSTGAKLLPLQLLRGVGLEQRQHVHLARKSLVEAVNADQIPDLYGSRVPCLQATMHGLPVATRPKIKMVQLQFTPFASDDTYHWQTTM